MHRGGTKNTIIDGRFLPSKLSVEGRLSRRDQAYHNPWIQFVNDYAIAHNISYGVALSRDYERIRKEYDEGVEYPLNAPPIGLNGRRTLIKRQKNIDIIRANAQRNFDRMFGFREPVIGNPGVRYDIEEYNAPLLKLERKPAHLLLPPAPKSNVGPSKPFGSGRKKRKSKKKKSNKKLLVRFL
jgi:hypothetical protein